MGGSEVDGGESVRGGARRSDGGRGVEPPRPLTLVIRIAPGGGLVIRTAPGGGVVIRIAPTGRAISAYNSNVFRTEFLTSRIINIP